MYIRHVLAQKMLEHVQRYYHLDSVQSGELQLDATKH
jgi:hypothetical protein